ncbi:hypothetical protein [Peribacillus sp. FSL E2-0159]|uniref:hypothetical protein n=1 Tax=Peribacillus sp. FSL E2-0159 TaxID=2975289 RepID=UPI00315A7947
MGVMETFLIALFGTFIANMASGWIFFKLAAGAEKKQQQNNYSTSIYNYIEKAPEEKIPNGDITGGATYQQPDDQADEQTIEKTLKTKTDYQYFKDFLGKGPSTTVWDTTMLNPKLQEIIKEFEDAAGEYVEAERKAAKKDKKD